MREQIAVIVDALMLSVLTQSTKKMTDEKRDLLLSETATWAVNEIMKVIKGAGDESSNTPFIG